MIGLVQQPTPTCGLDAALEVVAGKWKPLLLCALEQRPHRYGELRRALDGVSEKVLTQQLRELEADGIVRRETRTELAPRVVEYSLSQDGVALLAALAPLGAWAHERARRLGRDAPGCAA